MMLLCLAIALHDVDGPIHCASGEKIRLAGIGATEIDGTCRPNQPCVPGSGRAQRRIMARVMGARIAREDADKLGQLWFAHPIRLRCETVSVSYSRLVAWCRLPNGQDLSCAAIRAGVARRWRRFDPANRLRRCVTP